MRQTLGWLVFICGVLGLGYWAHGNQAKSIESSVRTDANAVDLGALDKVIVSVSGRDIVLTGSVATDGARELVLTKMSNVEGHRAIRDNMNIVASN